LGMKKETLLKLVKSLKICKLIYPTSSSWGFLVNTQDKLSSLEITSDFTH